jgi:hypothetical protein
MRLKWCGLLLLGLLVSLSGAQAATVSFSDSIALTTTNWDLTVSIPKFDATLGTLQKITFELAGHVEGDAKFESLDSAPATVKMDLSVDITLKRPDNSTVVVSVPAFSTTDSVTAYDGTLDFGGTSGKTYTGLTGDKTETAVSPPPASDLGLFTGAGNIVMPITAVASSSATGAGNIVSQFASSASADVKVTYQYGPAVPEASSLALFLFGASALGLMTKKRLFKAKKS